MVDAGGKKTPQSYATEKQARQVIRSITRELGKPDKTIDEALDAYEMYLRNDKGNKLRSVYATTVRLRAFFPDLDMMLLDLTNADITRYYDAYAVNRAVDTHRNVLAEARSFLKWCVNKRKWIEQNPADGVEGKGKRRHGKPQLYLDEARRWLSKAQDYASQDEWGAVAAMMTLLLGLRASEVVDRTVRDVDDDGRLLWIPASKTEAGRRRLVVPDALRPHLLRLIDGRSPEEALFGQRWRDWPRKWVQRICKEVGVQVVTAHGMRGLHSTLAVDSGITGHAVAAALGHESFTTTTTSYAQPAAVSNARQQRVLAVLEGGRK